MLQARKFMWITASIQIYNTHTYVCTYALCVVARLKLTEARVCRKNRHKKVVWKKLALQIFAFLLATHNKNNCQHKIVNANCERVAGIQQ